MCFGLQVRIAHGWFSTATFHMVDRERSQNSGGQFEELAQIVEGSFWRKSFHFVESL
jgi:hypothetical protein